MALLWYWLGNQPHSRGEQLCSRYAIKIQYVRVFHVIPTGISTTYCVSTTSLSTAKPSRLRLDISHLWHIIQEYYQHGTAQTTRKTYTVGQRQYINFCSSTQRWTVPTSESTLLQFVSHLAKGGLRHGTIMVYLFAVHHMYVACGKHVEFTTQLSPQLHQVLKGIKRTQSALQEPMLRRPITLDIMT